MDSRPDGRTEGSVGAGEALRPRLPGNWQDIASAPKDGSYIWLGKPGLMRIGYWLNGAEYELHGSVGGGWRDLMLTRSTYDRSDLTFAPTAWQPLPKPPES